MLKRRLLTLTVLVTCLLYTWARPEPVRAQVCCALCDYVEQGCYGSCIDTYFGGYPIDFVGFRNCNQGCFNQAQACRGEDCDPSPECQWQ